MATGTQRVNSRPTDASATQTDRFIDFLLELLTNEKIAPEMQTGNLTAQCAVVVQNN
jgi:hypothetical protein